MTDTLYKALKTDGTSPFQGYPWPLPQKNGDGWKPGEWVDAGEGKLIECEHGIHVCTLEQLPRWIDETLYVCEPAPGTDRLDGDDKTVVRRGRLLRRVETWTERTARLFAADCAERVLPLFEAESPDDDRPRRAIQAARDYAHGRIDEDELSAAWDAARRSARRSAWDAARRSAWDAAGRSAWDAAGAAAWDAARRSARAAAWDAARDAARAAARAAGWCAAGYAEREWQARRLGLYLECGVEAAEMPVETVEVG